MNIKFKNIKASLIFTKNWIERKSVTEKVIFKEQNVTYTNYKHTYTPHLLYVTGVKSIAQLVKCRDDMMKQCEAKTIEEKVNNVFFSKKDHKDCPFHGSGLISR